MKKNLFSLSLYILFPFLCFSQSSRFDSFVNDSLDNYIEKGLKEWNIPGLSISIVKDGKVVLNRGYGIRDIQTELPVDSNTMFMIGSLTKALTSAITVLASSEGAFELNDPVQKWLPDFEQVEKSSDGTIIIEDILTGRTGFGSHKGDFLFWKTNLDAKDLYRVLPELPFESEVRRRFVYNNLSYLLVDEILLNTTKMNWAESIESKIFSPLEMGNSYAFSSRIPSHKITNLALPHLIDDSLLIRIDYENIENMGPAGSVVSTSSDMSKWIQEFIAMEGTFPGSVKRTIRRPYQMRGYRTTKTDRDQLRFLFSGMGWNIFDEFDKLTYLHDGGTDGFKSNLMIIPEEEFGVIVLTNSRSHNLAEALVEELHYALMGQPFQNLSEYYLSEYKESHAEEIASKEHYERLIETHSKTQINPEIYTGVYANSLYGNMSIEESDGGLNLVLHQHQDGLKAKLNFIGDSDFYITFSNPEFYSTTISFSWTDDEISGFTYNAESSGDINYWFQKN